MTENLPNGTTNVVGYYNGAHWPVQLVISKYNVMLHLPPGDYIKDPAGRKYNDPFLEVYVSSKHLKRETTDTPIPIYYLPPPPGMSSHANSGNNPVRATSKFELNSKGVRVPAMPKSVIQPPQTMEAEQKNPVTAMTMDEARAAGLVRRARVVPEDYGDTDTTGRPNNTPPPIKYAIDSSMLKKPAPLPPEALKVESKAGNVPTRTLLVQQLQKSAASAATPESANVFLNKTTTMAPANSQIVAGSSTRTAMPVSVVRPPEPESGPEPELEAEPALEETAVEEIPQESPEPVVQDLPEADEAELDRPDLTELQEESREGESTPLRQVTPRDRFICLACGAPHKFWSQLEKHAKAKHKDQYAAILEQYPKEA